jgi:hypothetical protein
MNWRTLSKQNLRAFGKAHETGSCVDGEAEHRLWAVFDSWHHHDLAHVDANTSLQRFPRHIRQLALERQRTVNGVRGGVEGHEEAVPGVVLLITRKSTEAAAEDLVVLGDGPCTGHISEAPFEVCRAYEIGEEEDLENDLFT